MKHKVFSLLNLLGLTLGIASCLVIFLVVRYELSYDRFNTKADRTYRVTFNELDFNPSVSMAVAPVLRIDFPELEEVSQAWYRKEGLVTIREGENKYQEKGYIFVDKYFPLIFDYDWLEGNPKTALSQPNAIVLTKSIARKYFGNKEAMGQLINLDNQYDLKVTGIIKDVPGNTSLPFNFLVSFETVTNDIRGLMSHFYAISDGSFLFVVTPENYPVANVQNRIHGFIEKNWGSETAKRANLVLQPLTEVHFDQRYLNNTISATTSRETYYALTAVAILIIIIACINFINLATAQSIGRAREVGVRKVLGSSRYQLIAQFLAETTVMVLLALILALLITALFTPQLSKWLDIRISISQLLQPFIMFMVLIFTPVIILLAGLYPAFVQSGFKPITSLKNRVTAGNSGLTLRKSLVVIQFAISQVMIIGTLVVAYQMDFFQNYHLGFNKEAVISLSIPDQSKIPALKQQLLNLNGVTNISLSSGAPPYSNSFTSFISPEAGIIKDDVTEVKFVDEFYMDMFELKLLAGEKIRQTNTAENDTIFNVAVNETMIHKLNIHDPGKAIGKQIIINGNWQCTITGVVQDFQSESKHKKIRPCVLVYRPGNFYRASVKIRPVNMNKTISGIDKVWTGLFPESLFNYEFIDDHIAAWYTQEQKEYTAFKLFSVVAILIGCLGLYGLIAFAAVQRKKEVGIRKVLGASLSSIVLLFSKDFIVLITLAFVIAAPVAYWAMHIWLQGFAYQVTIGVSIFFIAIVSSFFIASVTIAWQAIKAGAANPVKSLRSE